MNSSGKAEGSGVAARSPVTVAGGAASATSVYAPAVKRSGPTRPLTVAPVVSSSGVAPGWPALSTRRTSGRRTSGGTPKKTPVETDLAAAWFTTPSVGEDTARTSILTRMPSRRARRSPASARSRSARPSTTASGSSWPVETRVTPTTPEITVTGGRSTSPAGASRLSRPVTINALPGVARAGGAPPIKTKMPSEVALSSSASSSGAWRKKPSAVIAVTMPDVVTVCPASGDASPRPRRSWMAMSPMAGEAVARAITGTAAW